MGFLDKMREPVILKEDSEARKQLEQLNIYLQTAQPEVKSQIEKDIKLLQYGIYGEDAIMFELKNSYMPMYVLHDIFFEQNGLTTQIDYLVITRKLVIVIECKNLFGNITIDEQGNFTRTVQLGARYYKEGLYSPITQNQRHIDMIHNLRRASKPALLRSAFDKQFEKSYRSLVVLANSKSVLDMRYAPSSIKEKIVKIDGLINYIKQLQENSKASSMSDKEMRELTDFFLGNSVQNTKDYTEKYRISISENTDAGKENEEDSAGSSPEVATAAPENIEESAVYQALKAYRFRKSKEEGVKAYFLYNNAQLEEIIKIDPGTLEELKRVSGFGDVKCAKYGNDILKILAENRS